MFLYKCEINSLYEIVIKKKVKDDKRNPDYTSTFKSLHSEGIGDVLYLSILILGICNWLHFLVSQNDT